MIMKSRKLIVPLIAIMVSAVALAGVVYAYSASVTSTNNDVDGTIYTIDLYNQAGSATVTAPIPAADVKVVIFSTNMDYSTEQVTINATADNKVVATAYVKIDTDIAGIQSKITISPSDPVTMTGLPAGLIITPSVTQVKQGENVIAAGGDGKYVVGVNTIIAIQITITVTGTTSWTKTIGDGEGEYATAQDAADAFRDAFDLQALYSVTITAEDYVAP